MVTHLQAIEFVGGPFDGHKEVVPFEAEDLVGMLALPVNHDTFELLEGSDTAHDEKATSVAVYHRVNEGGRLRYCFLGAASATYAAHEHVWG